MNSRKLISLLLIAVFCMTFAAAGCNNSTETVEKNDAENKNKMSSEELFFYDVPDELRGTVVKIASWGDGTRLKEDVPFTDMTGIELETVVVPQSGYIVKLASLIAADQAPDIFNNNSFFPGILQVAMPLTDAGIDVTDPFWDQDIVKMGTVGGKPYLIAANNDRENYGGGVIYFNVATLTENDIKTPKQYVDENNWNLDTLWTCMSQVAKITATGNVGTYIVPETFISAFGAQLIGWDRDNGKFYNGIKSDKYNNLLKGWTYYTKACEAGIAGTTFHGDTQQFIDGKTALVISGTWGLAEGGWFTDMDVDDVGYTFLPKINKDDENYPSTRSAKSYGICKGSKNPQGAAYYLRYTRNADNFDMPSKFKTQYAYELSRTLRETATFDGMAFDYGAASLVLENPNHISKLLYESPSEQLATNMKRCSNEVDACVEKANAIVAQVIEDNK